MPHDRMKAWTSKHPLRVKGSSVSAAVSRCALEFAAAPAKTSTSASTAEALSARSSPERALLQRPQLELMQEVQMGLVKPLVHEVRHEFTPQLNPLPRQAAQDRRTPFPRRQFETQVTLPAPGTPKQRPPQLCKSPLLSHRQ